MHLKIPKLVKADQNRLNRLNKPDFRARWKSHYVQDFPFFNEESNEARAATVLKVHSHSIKIPPTLFENILGYSIIFLINPFPDKSLLLFRQIGIRDACSTVDIFNCCSYLLLSISFVFVCFIRFICFYLLYLFLSASICFTCFKTVCFYLFLSVFYLCLIWFICFLCYLFVFLSFLSVYFFFWLFFLFYQCLSVLSP